MSCHVMSCPVIRQKRSKKLVEYQKKEKNQMKIHILSEIKKKVTEKKRKIKRKKSKIKNYNSIYV